MKVFCAVITLAFLLWKINAQQLHYTLEERRQLVQLSTQCISETKVLPQYVNQARLGNFIENDRLKSFAFCMAKKLGVQDELGNLNIEAIRQRLTPILSDPQLTEGLIQQCALQRATPEDTAYEAIKCAYDNTGIQLI